MGKQNRNRFRLTRFILLKLPAFFRFLGRFRRKEKNLLVVKTDAIGDYILFRNFLEVLRKSVKYRDYRITLLGNNLWKDVALKYDSAFVDEFIFCNASSLYDLPLQTLKLGWRLFRNNYEVVLQPSSTRLLITDGLAALTAAKQIIGFVSNNEGIAQRYKKHTDKFYTQLLSLPPDVDFEFERSKFFFENALDEPVTINGPSLSVNIMERCGIVIFPGTGIQKRGWEQLKWLELIKLILNNTNTQVYLAGGPGEIETGTFLTENLATDKIINVIGKTSLPELIELIGKSSLVMANETSAIHIAVATGTKSVCILGGGHFGRFAPYPAEAENAPVCIYEKMECFNCNWECIYQVANEAPFPCISLVSVEQVWEQVAAMLPSN